MRTGDAPADTSTVRGRLATQRAALPCGESRRRPFDALNADKAPDRKVGGFFGSAVCCANGGTDWRCEALWHLSVPPFWRTADPLTLRTPVAPDLAPCARLGAYRGTLGRAAGLSRAPRTPSLTLRRPDAASGFAVFPNGETLAACPRAYRLALRTPLAPFGSAVSANCGPLDAARRCGTPPSRDPKGLRIRGARRPRLLFGGLRRHLDWSFGAAVPSATWRGIGSHRFPNGGPLVACASRSGLGVCGRTRRANWFLVRDSARLRWLSSRAAGLPRAPRTPSRYLRRPT